MKEESDDWMIDDADLSNLLQKEKKRKYKNIKKESTINKSEPNNIRTFSVVKLIPAEVNCNAFINSPISTLSKDSSPISDS
jgi:hypothetical protein